MRRDYQLLAEELGARGRLYGPWLRSPCPVHGGRDPNFSVNIETGQWTCFSTCGSGNFVKLVSLVLGGSLTSAMDWIVSYDHALPPREPAQQSMPSGPPAWRLQYDRAGFDRYPRWWFDRGLDWDDAWSWYVRWDSVSEQLLIPYSAHGELLGTVARNFKRRPKYQNSPKLPRSTTFFAFDRLSTTTKSILIVEGALDAIWFNKHQLGLHAVALLGLTLSEQQLRLLNDFEEITLAMDNDEPGQEAQRKIRKQLRQTHKLPSAVKTVVFPPRKVEDDEGPRSVKDVGECTRDELTAMVSQRRIA